MRVGRSEARFGCWQSRAFASNAGLSSE